MIQSTPKRASLALPHRLATSRHMGPTYERCAELLEAELGDDIVGLEISRGECFGFNSVAAEVWRRLPASASTIRQELERDYDVDAAQCEADVQAVLDQMVEMGLVRARG